ncbi:Phage integrase [Trichormus variabilis ATCC 29413]|uniref:Phage integrase n=2 Tax=Anabaena variabilis TaxID=264691 RepID=Q3M2U5_TRIV2|nr:tyrosine-type recombinase/integrase [Trichormus variabilis]ABA24691.1 Phage integrase [Trichormus variabilis ATCC 29413]MBC1217728.1 tyrosine-type recombinase/integrase [Trichormus variabilis ARAD]MBC1258981.1 tyrosine-type recombinase/integrase [Trichormus variabilis V5]MBC1302692.1 tyrosine-type recombinase/integrase [Trichormus variabilis N2B]MBC1324547.1 tyrosine-type recombinase/integrase [Trichormus variabilis 9RC]
MEEAALVLETGDRLASLNPAAVYLASLGKGSRRTMKQALDAIALLATNQTCDAMNCPWGLLRYQHTMAIRAELMEKYAPATANKMLAALRRVLKEAQRLGQMTPEDYAKAADIKRVKSSGLPKGRALSSDELGKLLNVCVEDESIFGVRDAAMLMILRVGLRRGEVVNLDLADLDLNEGSVKVRGGKGRKDRVVFFPESAIAYLQKWVKIRGDDSSPLLLPISKSGNLVWRRLSDQAVLSIMLGRGEEAGIENFTPHDFRRTFAGDLLDAGVDIVTVQKLMGHADPATTAKYDRRGDAAKKRAVNLLKL